MFCHCLHAYLLYLVRHAARFKFCLDTIPPRMARFAALPAAAAAAFCRRRLPCCLRLPFYLPRVPFCTTSTGLVLRLPPACLHRRSLLTCRTCLTPCRFPFTTCHSFHRVDFLRHLIGFSCRCWMGLPFGSCLRLPLPLLPTTATCGSFYRFCGLPATCCWLPPLPACTFLRVLPPVLRTCTSSPACCLRLPPTCRSCCTAVLRSVLVRSCLTWILPGSFYRSACRLRSGFYALLAPAILLPPHLPLRSFCCGSLLPQFCGLRHRLPTAPPAVSCCRYRFYTRFVFTPATCYITHLPPACLPASMHACPVFCATTPALVSLVPACCCTSPVPTCLRISSGLLHLPSP